jgi:TP901 family phage tail tape measure protein
MAGAVVRISGEFDDAALRKAELALKRLGVEIDSVSKNTGPSFDAIGKKMQDVGDGMAKFGKNWSTYVTAPLAGLAAVSLKVAGDFDQTMNVLQVNANASEKQMKSLRDMAIDMGQKTVFSAGEAADAMLELSKGGLSAADIKGGALASTLALAATEGMGLADASVIVVQAMNTFGLKATDTAKVVDVLAAGAVASTAGVADLAAGLKYVGATANQFKIGVGESVTALAALNNAGLDSTTAGTSLNRFFLGLLGGTKKARDAIKDMGFEFFNANGEMRPMREVIAELEQGLKGLSDQDRAQTLKTIFGVEGMRAGNILLEQGVAGYDKLAKSIDKNGIAQEMADARMKGLKGSLEQLKGSMETAAIAIGTVMAPTVQSLAKFIQGLVDKFTGLPEPAQKVIVVLGAIVAAVGPLLLVGGKLISWTGDALIAFGKLGPVFTMLKTGAISLFQTLMANPFIALAAVVAITAVLIITHWDQVKAFLLGAWDAIKNAAVAVWDWLTNAFRQWGQYILIAITGPIGLIVALVIKNWDTIKSVTETVWNGIKAFFDAWFSVYKEVFTTVFDAVKAVVIGTWNAISNVAGTIWNGIKSVVLAAVNLMKTGIDTGLDAIKDTFTNVFNGIKSFIGGIFNGILSTIRGSINGIIGIVNGAINALNQIQVTIPDIPGVPGRGETFGVDIPTIPKLAKGGVVTAPTLALIGEAGPEAVVPLSSSRGRAAVGGVNIAAGAVQITVQGGADQSAVEQIERVVYDALSKLAREVSYA